MTAFEAFKKDLYNELKQDPYYHQKMFGYYPYERDFFTSREVKVMATAVENFPETKALEL